MAQGLVAPARLLFERAADLGLAQAAMALAALVADGKTPQKLAARARVVPLSGSGLDPGGGTLTVKNATKTIPIVIVGVNPVGVGVAASLSHPRGNVTALSYLSEEIISKRLQLLKELVPVLRGSACSRIHARHQQRDSHHQPSDLDRRDSASSCWPQ